MILRQMRGALAAALFCTVALAAQQPPPPPPRLAAQVPASAQVLITGRVVADETGDGIANARVSVTGTPLGAPVVLTDAEGRFALRAGTQRATVLAIKPGYARGEAIGATAGAAIEIRLGRAAAIAGRVVDDAGEPVLGARVTVETRADPDRPTSAVATVETDDRGEFRVGGLSPGNYLVALTTNGSTPIREVRGTLTSLRPSIIKTYYPGVRASADAPELALHVGEEQSPIDFFVTTATAGNQPFSVIRALGTSSIDRPRSPEIGVRRPTGRIQGRVIDTDGRALGFAQVLLLPQMAGTIVRSIRADLNGNFGFDNLPVGAFRLGASKTGYFPSEIRPSALRPPTSPGRTIELADGERRDQADITLTHWSTLSGYVLDEYSEPVQGASVQLLQIRYEGGRRRLVPTGDPARLTDDRGAYRLYGLPPGQYIVSASVGAASATNIPGYARAYFPGTTVPAEARFVSLPPSRDLDGITFNMSRANTVRVSGRIVDASGAETTGGSLTLVPSQHSSAVTSVPVGARMLANGMFEFANVDPGQYVIQAYRGRTNSWTEGEFGALPVSVADVDATDLVVRTSGGSRIDGLVTFDGAAPPERTGVVDPRAAAIELSPIPVDYDQSPPSNFATAEFWIGRSFRLAGISGPRRLQVLRAPPGWMLREIRVRGINVTDRILPFGRAEQSLSGVEVILTDRVSEVRGTVRDEEGRATETTVIVFSSDRDQWYPASRFLRRAAAGADGVFSIEGVPRASYYVAAVASVPSDGADAWQDPAFLESLIPRASSVLVNDGEHVAVNPRFVSDAR